MPEPVETQGAEAPPPADNNEFPYMVGDYGTEAVAQGGNGDDEDMEVDVGGPEPSGADGAQVVGESEGERQSSDGELAIPRKKAPRADEFGRLLPGSPEYSAPNDKESTTKPSSESEQNRGSRRRSRSRSRDRDRSK